MAQVTEALSEALETAIIAQKLGPVARRILLDIAKRLEKGAAQYGPENGGDFSDNRDWTKEAREEGLDMIVYLLRGTMTAEKPAQVSQP